MGDHFEKRWCVPSEGQKEERKNSIAKDVLNFKSLAAKLVIPKI